VTGKLPEEERGRLAALLLGRGVLVIGTVFVACGRFLP
jgi:hypothetical protein